MEVVADRGRAAAHERERRRPAGTPTVGSTELLGVAESRPADLELFRTQLGRLGGTIYELARIEATIEGRPMVPMSLLNRLRRELVTRLDEAATGAAPHDCRPAGLAALLEPILPNAIASDIARTTEPAAVELSVLCRRTDQIEAALELGVSTIYADYQDIKQYAEAVAAVRRSGAVRRSTWRPRGSRSRAKRTSSASSPSKVPTESWCAMRAACGFAAEHGIPFVADFSLNAANPLTVDLLKSRGAARVTASYDLNVDQLLQLIDRRLPRGSKS